MGSQCFEILRQGIWASLTGGWYYDPHLDVFTNTFHMYLWFYLISSPFCVYLYFSWTWVGWILHFIGLSLITFGINGTNYFLHHLFDSEECHEEVKNNIDHQLHSPSSPNEIPHTVDSEKIYEEVPMQVLNSERNEQADLTTLNTTSSTSCGEVLHSETSTDHKLSSVIDLKVEVHRKNSSSAGEEEKVIAAENLPAINSSSMKKCPPLYSEPALNVGKRAAYSKKLNNATKFLSNSEEPLIYEEKLIHSSFSNENSLHDVQVTDPSELRNILFQPSIQFESKSHNAIYEGKADLSFKIDSKSFESPFNHTAKEDSICQTVNENSPILSMGEMKEISLPHLKCVRQNYDLNAKASNLRLSGVENINQSEAYYIAKDRSCSEPNCSLDYNRDLREMTKAAQVRSYDLHEKLLEGKQSRRHERFLESEKLRKKPSRKSFDCDQPIDLEAEKDQASMLNSNTKYRSNQKSHLKLPESKSYRPLVFKHTTTNDEKMKVTTLTFENVDSVEKLESSSSSFDDTSSHRSCKDFRGNELPISNLEPVELCTAKILRSEASSNASLMGDDFKVKNSSEEGEPNISDHSSTPNLEWLFCHSESDSEFSKLPAVEFTKNLNNAKFKNNNSCHSASADNKKSNRSKTENLKKTKRKSPRRRRNSKSPSEKLKIHPLDIKCDSFSDTAESANLRDPSGVARHGAIPKQRRQGVVMRDSRDISDEGEAAGVTMELVRKMLDVFSSYPDNSQRDVKKLLVLVSLEQDNKNKRDSIPSTSIDGTLKENANLKDSNGSYEDIDTSVAHKMTPVPTLSNEKCDVEDDHYISMTKYNNEKNELGGNKASSLYRKPAVRRRRHAAETDYSHKSRSRGTIDAQRKRHSAHRDLMHRGRSKNVYLNDPKSQNAFSYFDKNNEMVEVLDVSKKLPSRTVNFENCNNGHRKGSNERYDDGSSDYEDCNVAPSLSASTNVHCFQDESGRWFTYTFNKSAKVETASSLPSEDDVLSSSSMSLCSGLTVVLDNQGSVPEGTAEVQTNSPIRKIFLSDPLTQHAVERVESSLADNENVGRRQLHWASDRERIPRTRNPITNADMPTASIIRDLMSSGPPQLHFNIGSSSNPLHLITNALFDRIPYRMGSSNHHAVNHLDFNYYDEVRPNRSDVVKDLKFASTPKIIQYYEFKFFGKKTIKVYSDRLSLMTLLDRNSNLLESIFKAFLVILVGVLGAILLYKGFYYEQTSFLFCFIIGSCQYSLFKSVQPDAASPTHGYNHIVLYSRSIYFIICCLLVLASDAFVISNSNGEASEFYLYGFNLLALPYITIFRDCVTIYILFFPVIFTFGLLPQINTFLVYIFEQTDIHIFGGNAMTSLNSAIYCVFRSIFCVLFLTGFSYGAFREPQGIKQVLFSIFCSLVVSVSFHLSRSAANPTVFWQLVQKHLLPEELKSASMQKEVSFDESLDPLPKKLRRTVTDRLTHDLIICPILALIVFAIRSSRIFNSLLTAENGQFPDIIIGVWILVGLVGFLNHYLIPQLKIQQPWRCLARPACLSYEYSHFEVYDAAKVMWFERVSVWLGIIEKNLFLPFMFLCAITRDSQIIIEKHPKLGPLMISICGLKCLRSVYSQPQIQYLVTSFTILFFNWDTQNSESFLVDYFFMLTIYNKVFEFILKIKFIVTYIAPWQLTWGSAFHAFAQPFSVPHSAMLFLQAAISSVFSTPLNPILGSAIFMTSYIRPIKFWERDYNTKRMDQSNTRLASSLLEQRPGADNNLNSIFYEHLTRSLQDSLCGDLIMGRWGAVSQGDCFVLASDNLNCLVHIIELGNGLVTFQVRGLEFRGTYCQQREVEAISEGVDEDGGCCCCEPGHLPHMLSGNAAFNQHWLAWSVTATKYVLEGYSISDNSAVSIFQMFELRTILITYYVKCIIFYVIDSPKLTSWLTNADIISALEPFNDKKFVDLDPTFHSKIDEDFDCKESGITRTSFCKFYLDWIRYCLTQRNARVNTSTSVVSEKKMKTRSEKKTSTLAASSEECALTSSVERTSSVPSVVGAAADSLLVSLCLGLSLVGRRTLGPSPQCDNVEVFLQFLHSLFKGDIRLTCPRDEWVFTDMELLNKIITPALRISLKLHQDHFLLPDEYDNNECLYAAIRDHEKNLVICHESDPEWKGAVLAGRPSLLSLRHVNDDGDEKFKIIMLNKRHLLFRVIKINRECVRGLWAGQQQELIFLRNRNPERGSIQNAKQALRNIINSSCDQPIGYPIYVSPLTTSYADTNEQLSSFAVGALTPKLIKNTAISLCKKLRQRCVEGSCGNSGMSEECTNRNMSAIALSTLSSRSAGVENWTPIADSISNSEQLQQILSSVPLPLRLSQDGSVLPGLSYVGHSMSGSLNGVTAPNSRGTLVCPSNLIRRELFKGLCAGLNLQEIQNIQEASDTPKNKAARGNPLTAAKENVREQKSSLSSTTGPGVYFSREFSSVQLTPKISIHMSDCDVNESPSSSSFPKNQPSTSSSTNDSKSHSHRSFRVKIIDENCIYDCVNLGRKIDLTWPEEWMRAQGGRNVWANWIPVEGMEGTVVHIWKPNDSNPIFRSHVDKVIYLVKIENYYVPVAKKGCQELIDNI